MYYQSDRDFNNYIGKRRRKNKALKLGVWIIILFILCLGIGRVLAKDDKSGKPLVDSFNFTDDWSFNFEDQSLQKDAKKYLQDKKGNFAVWLEALEPKDEAIIKINSTQGFPAASLYKIFLMAAVFDSIEKGELTEDKVLTENVDHLEEVVGKEFGYEDYEDEKLSYTVSEALTRVATISDNYAAIMLAEIVGWEKVRATARSIGATDTSIKDPITTTAYDVGLFFKKLYLKQIISPSASEKILDLLAQSRLNNRIPELLPEDTKVVHKTGELSRVRNDAGIVYLEGKPYVIVLLSKDLTYEDDGVEILQQLSKMSYDYMSENKNN